MIAESTSLAQELAVSGGRAQASNSVRAGFMPVPLERVPVGAFDQLPVYIRVRGGGRNDETFTLYRGEGTPFTDADRTRLLDTGIALVYIRMNDQTQFRQQTESSIDELVKDPRLAVSQKSSIVYETGVELVNELLADPDLIHLSPRLDRVSRAITTLIMNDPSSFSHLFAAAHHDFYTSTHMVNVAAYLVPLAYELGYRSSEDLTRVCEAGLLHDIGKVYVPETVLNKPGRLSDEDWWLIQRHPELAFEHLREYDGVHEVVLAVAREHHERLDGSGYPHGLRADQMHPMSKMCAIVDAFDAMTALRPFKKRTLTVAEALEILKKEAPEKFDPEVLEAWIGLVNQASCELPDLGPAPAPNEVMVTEQKDRRRHARFRFNCPARLHLVEAAGDDWVEKRGIQVIGHNISRSGVGLLSRTPVSVGELVHLYLHARVWNREFLEGSVMRCRRYNDGWFEVGVELAEIAPYAVVPSSL